MEFTFHKIWSEIKLAGLKKIGIIIGVIGVAITTLRLIPVFFVFFDWINKELDPLYATSSYLLFLIITAWVFAVLGVIVLLLTDRNASIGLFICGIILLGVFIYTSITDFVSVDINVYNFDYMNIGSMTLPFQNYIEALIYLIGGLLVQLGVRKERK